MRRALLVARVLNRTLVLPPILRQSDLAFGPPEVRCRDSNWPAYLQARAEELYEAKLQPVAHKGPPYESLFSAYDFRALQGLGVRVVDYADLPVLVRTTLRDAPLAPLGCAKGDRYTAVGLRAAMHRLWPAAVVRVGSPYFLKAELEGLRKADGCFDEVFRAVLRLPHAPLIRRVSDAALRRLRAPFASVHLRLTDGGGGGAEEETAEAAAARKQFVREVGWLTVRLGKRLAPGCCGLYVATNLPGGVRSSLLAGLCAGAHCAGARCAGVQPPAYAYDCSDQTTLGVRRLPEWAELLASSRLSEETASLLIDQALGAAAGRGFFSTSKFCGPPGFRRSTFSEGIALRWQQRRNGSPLCAHAMEHALARGWAAHGELVY